MARRRFRVNELIYDPIGSMFDGRFSRGAYGGHRTHVHAAALNAATMLAIIRYARRLGLAVRENPYTDPVDPVHTEGSHHYQTFPGRYHGRELGRAADISGNKAAMARLFRWVRGRSGGAIPGGGMPARAGGAARNPQVAALLAALSPGGLTPQALSYRSPQDVLASLTPQTALRPVAVPDFAAEHEADLAELRRALLA